tara:strand:+ start:1548 stop:1949 length:402 start_codon:yes stop_codon:yes gene_type:complete
MESYYNTVLTPEFYKELHSIGYKWVINAERYRLLMLSVNRSGFSWESVKNTLLQERNIEFYKHGPSPREAWAEEVDKINTERRLRHGGSKLSELSYCQNMDWKKKEDTILLSDKESNEIYIKWENIRSGRISW